MRGSAQSNGAALRRRGALTLGLLCLVSIVNYMDRILLSVTSQPIKQEFHLSDTQLGLLTGVAFALLYAVLGFPMGRLADHMSRKRLLTLCLTFWSMMTVVTGLATSFTQLAMARMTIAFGEAGVSPTAYTLIADSFVPRLRNFALGVFGASQMLGIVAGFIFGGWISQHYGWRTTFICLGAPGLLLAIVVAVMLREPARGATDDRAAEAPVPALEALRILRNTPAFLALLAAAGVNSIGIYATAQWMPQFFIRSHGLSLAMVGLLFGVAFGLGMLVGNLLGGAAASHLGRHSTARPLWLSAAMSVAMVPLYCLALLTPSVTIAIIVTAVAAIIGAMANPPSTAACQNLAPANVRGTASALLMLSSGFCGLGFGPLLVGMASDLLTARYGTDGLRFALIGLQAFNLLAAILYGLTARAMPAGQPHETH